MSPVVRAVTGRAPLRQCPVKAAPIAVSVPSGFAGSRPEPADAGHTVGDEPRSASPRPGRSKTLFPPSPDPRPPPSGGTP